MGVSEERELQIERELAAIMRVLERELWVEKPEPQKPKPAPKPDQGK
jgi:hypothetical protein